MEEREPLDDDNYDTRAEELRDWYEHYMAIQPDDLLAEWVSRELNDSYDVSKSMRWAVEERRDELLRIIKGDENECGCRAGTITEETDGKYDLLRCSSCDTIIDAI